MAQNQDISKSTAAVAASTAAIQAAPAAQPQQNPADELLAKMTLEEKIGQMTQVDRQFLKHESDIKTFFLGSLLSGGGSAPSVNTPASWANMYDRYQGYALQTRLAIPLIYGIDAVHGHNNVHSAVIFPHNIGLGCTRNPALVEEAARVTALEVAGTGINWTFSPCIAVVRNERWGRTYESFGETPDLAKELGAAAVRGFQGKSLSGKGSVLACAKHYLGDGGTTNGVDQGNTEMDEKTLREIHLPGYISAIAAGAKSIMPSYSSWNGQKMHGNHYLLTKVLKEELGFKGFLISDWAAIDQLSTDTRKNVELSINAGLDMIMVPEHYETFISTLTALVKDGKIPMSRIDDAVRRILTLKFEMGLFAKPLADRELTAEIGSPAHRDVARKTVRESLVLLKNNKLLPLSKKAARIVVAGSNANDLGAQCGGWTISWQGASGSTTVGTTILQAVMGAVSTGTIVTYSPDGSGAAGADYAIAVIGEKPYAEGKGDRTDLALSKEDALTVANLKKSSVPVVAVLVSGRPMILGETLDKTEAFIAAWLPGSEGQGVTDVLFGDYKPTGKLSHSWPKDMKQVPINVGDANYAPLFEYGYGLTYQ